MNKDKNKNELNIDVIIHDHKNINYKNGYLTISVHRVILLYEIISINITNIVL